MGKAVHAALQQWSKARWRGQAHDAPALREGFLMNWITGQEDAPVSWEAGEEDEQQEKAWGLVDMYLRDTPISEDERLASLNAWTARLLAVEKELPIEVGEY